MDEFVSKKLLVAKFNELASKYIDGDKRQRGLAYTTAADMIALADAADVQPVKHGRWIPQGDDMWLCSNCKENIIFSMHESDRTEKQRYCCKCGARMDGEQND